MWQNMWIGQKINKNCILPWSSCWVSIFVSWKKYKFNDFCNVFHFVIWYCIVNCIVSYQNITSCTRTVTSNEKETLFITKDGGPTSDALQSIHNEKYIFFCANIYKEDTIFVDIILWSMIFKRLKYRMCLPIGYHVF